ARAGGRRRAGQGPRRARSPGPRAETPAAVIVNTAGGIAGGDRHALNVDVGAGARLTVTTAAAEKVYRSLGPESVIEVRLSLGAGARLAWLPQETILFDRARLRRTIAVDLAENADLILVEAVTFGRTAMGETVRQGSLFDCWRVRRDGRLVFAETARLDGAIAERLRAPAVAAGGAAMATMLIVPGDEARLAALRQQAGWQGEVGFSVWNGLAVARFLARDGARLRQDIITALGALGTRLPRLWLN